MFIRAYLRASTSEQDATRAIEDLNMLVECHKQQIANTYIENVSGTNLERPELNRLINDAKKGDVLLVEKMDRLTRLPFNEWRTLKARINDKQLLIVAADQPMTHAALTENQATSAIQQALTEFMLDLGAAMARDDYETRQKRQRQGIEKALKEGKYRGRPVDSELHKKVNDLLTVSVSWSKIQNIVGCSRATIAKVAKSRKEAGVAIENQMNIDV